MGQRLAWRICDLRGKKSPANLLVGPHRAQAREPHIWHIYRPRMSLHRLIPLFERARLSHEPLVLATVIRTGGSTYAKPGAQMLIAGNGEYAGLLSGGCLEGDLREHARTVLAAGAARIVSYDLRSKDDQLFGLGAGCEGAMDILLTRHGPEDGDWQPLDSMESAHRDGSPLRLGFVTATNRADLPLGSSFPADGELPDFVRGDSQVGTLLATLHQAALRIADNTTGRVDSLE